MSDVGPHRNTSDDEDSDHECMQHAVACLRVGVFSGGAKHRSWGSLLTDQVGFLGAAAQRSRFYRSALNATAPPCATSDHAGTSGVEAKGFAVSSSLRGRPQEEDCRHGEWLEVVRTNDKFLFGRQDEGHAGNGCWFNHALGSGIFFNVGRTRLLYKKGSPGSLITEWLADGNRSVAQLQAAVAGHTESVPLLAADLSYDSVQMYHSLTMGSSELVVTQRLCMASPLPLGSCTPLLDLRTWSGRHDAGSCTCNDTFRR